MHNASNNKVNLDSSVYQFINQQILPLIQYSKQDFWRDFNQQYANNKNTIVPISTQFLAMKIVQGHWFAYPFESKNRNINNQNLCDFLDKFFPLFFGSHKNVKQYKIVDSQLVAMFDSWTYCSLKEADRCVAFGKSKVHPKYVLLQYEDMHILLQFEVNEVDSTLSLQPSQTFIRTEQSILLNFDIDKSLDEDNVLEKYKKIKAILSKDTQQKLDDKLLDKTLYRPDGSVFELPIKKLSLVSKTDPSL